MNRGVGGERLVAHPESFERSEPGLGVLLDPPNSVESLGPCSRQIRTLARVLVGTALTAGGARCGIASGTATGTRLTRSIAAA